MSLEVLLVIVALAIVDVLSSSSFSSSSLSLWMIRTKYCLDCTMVDSNSICDLACLTKCTYGLSRDRIKAENVTIDPPVWSLLFGEAYLYTALISSCCNASNDACTTRSAGVEGVNVNAWTMIGDVRKNDSDVEDRHGPTITIKEMTTTKCHHRSNLDAALFIVVVDDDDAILFLRVVVVDVILAVLIFFTLVGLMVVEPETIYTYNEVSYRRRSHCPVSLS